MAGSAQAGGRVLIFSEVEKACSKGEVVGGPTGRGGPEGFSGVCEEVTISITKEKGEAAGYCLVNAERDG